MLPPRTRTVGDAPPVSSHRLDPAEAPLQPQVDAMPLVRIQHDVRDELAGRSGSHRVPAARLVGRERTTVHAHRIRGAAVAVKAPHGRRARQVQVEGGLFPNRHRCGRAIPDLHAVMDGAGTRRACHWDAISSAGSSQANRSVSFRPSLSSTVASTNRHCSGLLWPATSTWDKRPNATGLLIQFQPTAGQDSSLTTISPAAVTPSVSRVSSVASVQDLCQLTGGRTRRRLEISGKRFPRGRRIDPGVTEIGQGLVPDAEVVDQPAEAPRLRFVTKAHGHRHR